MTEIWSNPWGDPWKADGGGDVPAREWEGWTEAEYETYIDSLISTHTTAWESLADAYDDQVRHVISGLAYAYEVLGTASYKTLAENLASRVISAYPASFDQTRDLRMHEGWRYAASVFSSTTFGNQATTVLEDSRNQIVGDGRTWRLWSYQSIDEPFQFSPYPAGRWEGQKSFAARLCKGYDTSWESDLEGAFRQEAVTETYGYWGAGWNEGYAGARVGEKFGRDAEWVLVDLGDADLRAVVIRAFETLYQSGYTFYQFIDGTTQDASYHDGIFAYDGTALLSQYNAECSTVCHAILDAVSTGDTGVGTIYFINYHSNGHRQFRLACSLLKAFAGFSA
ncbi:MAG: hypothetical protein KDC38_19995 [Planctomycetes bacterium]|nr:hypothetical protein [Planctomycetota bacterium]